MSLVKPMTNMNSTSTIPIALARSMTENGIGRPRSHSTSAKKMCPPSSGRNGNRLMTPSDSEITASRNSACVIENSNVRRVTS